MSSVKKELDLCSGPLFGKIWKFSFPLMLTGLLQLLYNAADVVVVGRYAGQESLAAVGTSSSILNLTLNLFIGLSGGVSVVMARAYGAKNDNKMHRIVHTSVLISFITGIFLTVFGAVFTQKLLHLIDVPENVMPQAVKYMRILFYGMVPSMLYNFGSGILRSKGDTKRPLIIISISGIINVVLNLFFVIKFGMKADGVGLATIISQTFSAIMILILLTRENDSSKLVFQKLKIYKKELLEIIKIGIPAGMQGVVFSLSNVIIQSGINSFGSVAIAGNAAAGNIEGFMFVALNTYNQTSMTFISQNIGAKKYERINKIIKMCLLYVIIIGSVTGLISVFLGKPLLKIYCPNDFEAIKWGYNRMLFIGTTYIFCGMQDVMCGSLRGMGASFSSMITAVLGVCGIRIVWVLTVFKALGTFNSLVISYPISWIGTFILYFILYIFVKKNFNTNNLTLNN